MSSMSLTERLLDGVEVKWTQLDDVGEFLRGKRFVKADMISEGIPCIHYGEMYTHFGIWADQAKSFLDKAVASKLRVANPGDVIIVAAGETIEDIGNATAWLGASDVVFHDACFSFKSKLDPKYVSYYLRTKLFKEKIKSSVSSGKISSINARKLGKAEIPVPCPDHAKKSLEIQAEIVRILDAFTAMTAELTAELSARQKQYNYYRDKLLSFEEGEVEWKTLGEVALDFGRGKSRHRPRNDSRLYGGDIPFIQTGDIRNAHHVITEYTQTYTEFGLAQSKLWPKGTLCITIAANIAETTILGFDSCFPDSVIGFVADPEKTTSSYVEYLLSSLKSKLQSQSTGSAQDNINMGTFENLRLPFPTLIEQKRIVDLLDRFEALTNSLTEGLPREIELRQKQYEHYRDLLLSFPTPEAKKAIANG
jgi:type I restriction enzyme S subunit